MSGFFLFLFKRNLTFLICYYIKKVRPGSVSVTALDSGSRGCVFDPSRGRILDFVVVGSNLGRGSPSLSSLRGRYSGYHEFLVGKAKPPGVAPWLYRSHESEQFDDILLRPKAEVSAVWGPFTFTLLD